MISLRHRLVQWALPAACAWGWLAATGWAVIRLPDLPLTKVYASSRQVIVGRITAVNPSARIIETDLVETLKGPDIGPKARIQVVQPEQILNAVSRDAPAVIFVSGASQLVMIHLADTWLAAQAVPQTSPPVWRVTRTAELALSFPGRTAALVRILADLRDRKSALLERVEDGILAGGIRKLGRLDLAGAEVLAAADVTGQGRTALLVGRGGQLHLFLPAPDGFSEVTERWGLKGASCRLGAGSFACSADINADGIPDLLAGSTLYLNRGGTFAPLNQVRIPSEGQVLSLCLIDITADKRADLVALRSTGELSLLQNPGPSEQPWPEQQYPRLWTAAQAAEDPPLDACFGDFGDNGQTHVLVVRRTGLTRYPLAGGEPADFYRLTGQKPEVFTRALGTETRQARCLPGDFNGDGRLDCAVLGDHGVVLLLNRGFGAFFVNPDALGWLGPEQSRWQELAPSAGALWAAADLQADRYADLVVLRRDGAVFQIVNDAPARGP